MENKWEYDYSSLYTSGGGTPPQEPPVQPAFTPAPDQPPVQDMKPAKKKRGIVRRILTGALALVVAAGVGFGGGWAGYMTASQVAGADSSSSGVVLGGSHSTVEPAGDSGASALSKVDVSSLVEPSVVVITTEQVVMSGGFFGQYVESGAGSGVVMTQDGYIITNNHVVEGASSIKVTLYDGTEYTATLVGADSQTDIAVIKVEAEGLVPAVLGDSDTLAVGQEVLAVGNPLGTLGGTVTNGIVSALNRSINVEGQTMTLIQHSAQVSPGNSGGGLFNMNGELVGIVNAKSGDSEAEGIGFAIPVNTAKEVAQELISNGYVTGRPALGVSVISGDTAMQYFGTSGVYIVEVVEGGGAANAGLQYGDRIVSMDGTLVETTDELTDALSAYSAGDTVELQVARKGQLFTVQVTLGEKSAS